MENEQKILRKRVARVIPFGYKESEKENYLEPIQEEIDALEQARKYIKGSSYREVADWIFRKTGRRLTGMGLRKVLNRQW
jgi:hypothetical protein|tara:strand:+ start:973 stop:1212 length:240 start_codon:yes stop_codon:yes gene_type:complete